MSEPLGVTVADLVATAKECDARIPAEIGAFVALEVCEALLDGPAVVRTSDVRIASDGTVSVFAPPDRAPTEEAARSVVTLLAALLVAAGTGVPRGLVALLDRGGAGPLDLTSLRDELEASLVPLNRGAARRVLSRMLREVKRPRSVRPRSDPPPPRDASLDALLDALLDGQGISPPRAPAPAELDPELDATLSELDSPAGRAADEEATLHDEVVPTHVPSPSEPSPSEPSPSEPSPSEPSWPRRGSSDAPAERPPAAEAGAKAVALPTNARAAATASKPARRGSPTVRTRAADEITALADNLEPPRRGGAMGWVLAFAAILTATAAGVALLRPDLIDRLLGREPPSAAEPGPTPEERAAAERERRGRLGTLTVQVGTPRAQVLVFVGRGPAVATELPLGVAHEFVAIADGRRPTRAIVPPDAQWPTEGEGRRYELAMQAGSDEMTELDIGASELPQDVGRPSGTLGSVRVITNPPGAEVYRVVGFAPEVTVENVRADQVIELLVALPGAPVERVVVGPSDWETRADGSKLARVSVTPREPGPAPGPRR